MLDRRQSIVHVGFLHAVHNSIVVVIVSVVSLVLFFVGRNIAPILQWSGPFFVCVSISKNIVTAANNITIIDAIIKNLSGFASAIN